MIKAGIILLAFAVAGVAGQSGSTTQSNNNSGNNHWQSNSAERHRNQMQNPKAKLSNELGSLLQCTENARTAIKQQNRQQALQDVQQALNSASQARSQHSGTGLAPLYTELEEVSVIEPILQRHQANGQNQYGSNQNGTNQSGSADRSTSQEQNRGLAVHEVVGDVTGVFLDVNAAQKHLMAAQQALNNNNMTQADRDLQAVEDSVVVESFATDMPLVRARENLLMARQNAESGKYRQSQTDLRAASRALSDYEKTNGRHSAEARQLQSEIDTYAQSMQSSHNGADSKIESWWNQTTNWMTPANAGNQGMANNGRNNQPQQH